MDVKVVSREHQLGAFPHFSHLPLSLSLLHYSRILCVFLSGNNTCGVGNGGCSHLCLMRSTYSYVCACPDGSTDTSCSEKPRFDGNSFDVRIESVTFFIFSSRQLHFQLCEINVSLLLIFCSCSEPDAARGLCRRPQQSRDVTLVACVLAVVLVLLLLLAVIVVVLVLKKSDFFSFSLSFQLQSNFKR